MEITTIGEAAQVLYGLPTDEFTEARNSMVKQIRASGDRDLADGVKSLRRPSALAAEVNRIVRADPGGIELILQAAGLLRDAQTGALAGSSIDASELQQQYRAAIRALAQSATTKPAEVRAALEAATIDEASNDALRAGCLVTVPTPTSIFGTSPPVAGAVDELAVRRAEKATRKVTERKAATKASNAARAAADAEAEAEAAERAERERRERDRAEQQVRVDAATEAHEDALRTREQAESAAQRAGEAVDAAQSEVAELREERTELERRLRELAERQDTAEAALTGAEAEADAAGAASAAAATALAEAATALEETRAALAALDLD